MVVTRTRTRGFVVGVLTVIGRVLITWWSRICIAPNSRMIIV